MKYKEYLGFILLAVVLVGHISIAINGMEVSERLAVLFCSEPAEFIDARQVKRVGLVIGEMLNSVK